MPARSSTTVRDKPKKAKVRRFDVGPYSAEARPLGKGGMCTAPDGGTVAVKELMAHLVSDARMVKRFRQEFTVVAAVEHPNVVTVRELVRANDTYNIVMEYVDGVSLREVLAKVRRIPQALAVALGYQLAETVRALHDQGVLHRDLKPGNVMLARDGTMKLTDFGIAHLAGTRMTATGMVLGSPTYMSPEQLAGRRDAIDGRSDVYALGVLLYECVEGMDPFRVPRHEDLMAVLDRKRTTEPKPMRRCDDEALEALLRQCVAVEPGQRPADMTEVASRLAAAAERGVGAPAGREVGRELLRQVDEELARREERKKDRAQRKAAAAEPPAPESTTRVRVRERRTFIWVALAVGTALAAAAFLVGDRLTG